MANNKKFILLWLFFVVVLFAGFLYFSPFSILPSPASGATTDYYLSGWLWSSNIGWVKLNDTAGTNYKVAIDLDTGNLSGYAWSSNIGWIKFNPNSGDGDGAYPSAGPSYSANINFETGEVSGWLKAVQADLTNGGWDGWIKIIDASAAYDGSNIKLTGWAWGDLIVGWLNFYDVKIVAGGGESTLISCDFSASLATGIKPAQKATLSWDCNSAAKSCSIDNGVGDITSSLPKNSADVSPAKTTQYKLSCSGLGEADFYATVLVCSTPPCEPGKIDPYKFEYKEVSPSD